MTLVATAGIFTTAHNISNIVNNLKEEKEVNNSYETEFNESDLDIVEEPIVVFYPNENKLEIQESEIQESEIQETETQETEIQEIENQETETQEIETQETEIQETETQKTETQETETQETEIQEIETKKAETQETETQETETQEAETQETETQEAETQKTEIQETETQESKIQERNEMKEAENKEKLEKFRQDAMVAYMNAFVIGEKPKVGDMLLEKPFSSSPDGSGSIGHFYKDVDYKVEHITIIAPEDGIQ